MKARKNKRFIPTFMRKLDEHLLFRYPTVWETQIHFVLFYALIAAIVFFIAGLLYPNPVENPVIKEPLQPILMRWESYFLIFFMICLPAVIYWGYQQIKTKKQDKKIKKILTSFLLYGLMFFFIFGITIPSFRLGTIVNTGYFMIDNEHFDGMQSNDYLYGFTLPDSIDTQNLNSIDDIIDEGENKFKSLKEKEDKILDNGYKGYYKFGLIRYRHDVAGKWDLSYLSNRSYLSDNSNFFDESKMSDLLKKTDDSLDLDTLHIGNLPCFLEKIADTDKFNTSDSLYLIELSNLSGLSNETNLSDFEDIKILPFLSNKSYWHNSLNRTSKSYLYFRLHVFQSDTLHKSDKKYLSHLSDLVDRSFLVDRLYLPSLSDRWYKSDLAHLSHLSYLSDRSYRSDLTYLSNLSDSAYLSYLSDRWYLSEYSSYLLYLSDRSYRSDLLYFPNFPYSPYSLDLSNGSYLPDKSDKSDKSNLAYLADLADKSNLLYKPYRLYRSDKFYKSDLADRSDILYSFPICVRELNESIFFWSTLFSKYDSKYKDSIEVDIGERYESVTYNTLNLANYMEPQIDSLKIKLNSLKTGSSNFSYWSKEVDTMQLYLNTLKTKIPDISFYTPYWFYKLEPDFRRAENARRYLKYGFVDYLKWVLHYLPFLCILLLALYYANLNSFFSALYLSLCVFLVILFLGEKFFNLMEWEFKDYLYFNYVGILYGLIALGILCTQAWSKRNNAFTVFGFHIILVTITLFFFLGIVCDYHVFMYQWIDYTVPCWVLFTIQAIGISAVLLMAHIRSLPRS